ncbi:MAG TPA: RNA-guided endonuclease TnpB family protein [Rhabdochlamydiaceae bacterium]|nr:RNA-guided endonuclease TnpB family protein [Rhabdochlamydiaceae bacterium]
MFFTKTYKFCLRSNAKKEILFSQFAGASRWIFNRGLDQRSTFWEKEKRSISLFEQNNELVLLKNQEPTCWLKEIHSQVLQQALEDLNKAFSRFFRRVKNKETPGYPHFRCKGENDSFRYPQGVKVQGNRVWLPKIGWVKFRKSREIEGKIKQTTIIKKGNRWYVCFSCEIEKEIVQTKEKSVIGIDVGLEHFATIASAEGMQEIENPRFFQKYLSKITYLSRKLSKKKTKGKNRLKAKLELSVGHVKIRNRRQDKLHKLSTQLVKSHDIIVVESLKVKELLMSAPKQLARAISDAGWRDFLQMLKYKCAEMGKKLIEMGQYFPSTKQCYNCKKRNEIPLSTREYQCECGYKIHRDHNAALNLRAAGTSVLKLVELPQ